MTIYKVLYPTLAKVLAGSRTAKIIRPKLGAISTADQVIDHISASDSWEGLEDRDKTVHECGDEWVQVMVPISQLSKKVLEILDVSVGYEGMELAEKYAKKPARTMPPVVLAPVSPGANKFGIVDGRHRILAAKLRGDREILALVPIKRKALPKKRAA